MQPVRALCVRYPRSMKSFRLLTSFVTFFVSLGSLPLIGQTSAHRGAAAHSTVATHSTAAPAHRPVAAALRPYVSCKLPLGPDLVQRTSLPHAPMTRPAQTLTGVKQVRIVDGLFTAYAYPNSAPFANMKVELLPAASYTTEKGDLIGEFDKINAMGEDTQRNYGLKPTLNGFEIYGFDRTALDGNVLGIYLFFDNAHHIATTAYFLNAPQGQRKFDTISEYRNLRESFLNAYTVCVRQEISGAGTQAKKSAPAKRATRH